MKNLYAKFVHTTETSEVTENSSTMQEQFGLKSDSFDVLVGIYTCICRVKGSVKKVG